MHWDGYQWAQVYSPNPNPNPNSGLNDFLDVEAVAPNDVWAVGYTYSSGNAHLTLTEHWDGTQWSIVPSPSVTQIENSLVAISSVSSNDVWAVGHYISNQGINRTLVEHWDGTQWHIVSSPNLGNGNNKLYSVSAVSANDVWAVGYSPGPVALIMHWDGVQWSIIPNPNPPGTQLSTLLGVSALSPNDVWAVGRWADATVDHTLIKRWNGVQWIVVPSPDAVPQTNWLFDVSPISPTDVWAVGYYCCGVVGATTLIEHWDGTQWSIVPNPNGVGYNYFEAVASVSANDVWAVGYHGSSPWNTLIERYSITDACLTPSPTATSTFTPTFTRTSTSTRTPSYTRTSTTTPTNTDTSTPTQTPSTEITLIGHVYWEARPPQPDPMQQLPITLTLRSDTTETDYPAQITDQYGFFAVPLSNLPTGTYTWRVTDAVVEQEQRFPNYLINAGILDVGGGEEGDETVINVEMGLVRAGDANHDNVINVSDFNIMKVVFGMGCGDPEYDSRPDFTGDCRVNATDFAPLKRNFGQSGALPTLR